MTLVSEKNCMKTILEIAPLTSAFSVRFSLVCVWFSLVRVCGYYIICIISERPLTYSRSPCFSFFLSRQKWIFRTFRQHELRLCRGVVVSTLPGDTRRVKGLLKPLLTSRPTPRASRWHTMTQILDFVIKTFYFNHAILIRHLKAYIISSNVSQM